MTAFVVWFPKCGKFGRHWWFNK